MGWSRYGNCRSFLLIRFSRGGGFTASHSDHQRREGAAYERPGWLLPRVVVACFVSLGVEGGGWSCWCLMAARRLEAWVRGEGGSKFGSLCTLGDGGMSRDTLVVGCFAFCFFVWGFARVAHRRGRVGAGFFCGGGVGCPLWVRPLLSPVSCGGPGGAPLAWWARRVGGGDVTFFWFRNENNAKLVAFSDCAI